MGSWDKEFDRTTTGMAVAAALIVIAAVIWTVLLGVRARSAPSSCPDQLNHQGPRCCAPGQRFSEGLCRGTPNACPEGMQLLTTPHAGCVLSPGRIAIQGGSLTLGPTDWDSVSIVSRQVIAVRSFEIEHSEVTAQRYRLCVEAEACSPLPLPAEPGLPVTGMTAEQAQRFCEFSGGRLPTPEEWLFAAAGAEGRRFPWGPHGLTCRRAAFGLVRGPCATSSTTAEIAGARPAGQTPDGVFDLAGNVAELTKAANGSLSVHGGSYRSRIAGDLKTWSRAPFFPAVDVGFRCAYAPSDDAL